MANKNPETKGLRPFQQGESGNPNGRPKGLKKQIKELLTKHIPDIQKQLEGAAPDEKIKVLASLADMVIPITKTT